MKDEYYEMENDRSHTLNKEWLFFKTDENCSIHLHVYEWNSGEYEIPSIDCSQTPNSTLNLYFEDRTYSISYSIKALPKFEKFFQLMYIWDVSAPSEDIDELYLKQEL